MRRTIAGLALILSLQNSSRADFQWLGPWQASITVSQPSRGGASATAATGDLNADTFTASAFATENPINAPGGPFGAGVEIDFSRSFRLANDRFGGLFVDLDAAASGTLEVTHLSYFPYGTGYSGFRLTYGIVGMSPPQNPQVVLPPFQVVPKPEEPTFVQNTEVYEVYLNDGTYTVSGTISVGAGKSSGPTAATTDCSLPHGFSATVTPVPEPTSFALMGLGASAVLVVHARRVRRRP